MSGRIGDLSEQQAAKLDQFKENLKDVLQEKHDHIYLLRFLRAREFDLQKAEALFRKDFQWRQKFGMDTFMKEYVPPEVLTKFFGGGIIGCDKEGSVVFLEPLGKRDVKGLMYSSKVSDILKYNIKFMEECVAKIVEQNKRLSRDTGGLLVLADLDGFGGQWFWKPWMELNKKLVGNMEQHYPEFLKRTMLINAPTIFRVLFSIMKPLMPEKTRNKFNILGSDWKTEVLTYIDAEVLPAYWGGTRTDSDGDPKCPSVVNQGGTIPKSYYLKDMVISDKNLTTREVGRGAILEFQYEVRTPGSLLNYEFETKEGDISFSVRKLDLHGNKMDVIVKERYSCHIAPADGHEVLDEPGTYVVKFDNSYSLLRSKTLSYFVELLEPLDDDELPEYQEQDGINELLIE